MSQKTLSQKLKEQTQQKVFLSLTLLGLVYGVVFLPPSVLDFLGQSFSTIQKIIARGSLLSLMGGILGYLLSAQDILATGRSAVAQFYRSQYPSNIIIQRYNCTQAQADTLWFQVFNPWSAIAAMLDQYKRTRERGLDCRFIVLLRQALVAFFVASLVTWITSIALGKFGEPLESAPPWVVYARILVLGLALMLSGSLYRSNKVADKARSTAPTGCWYRWQEINGMNKTWLETNVLQRAPTYQDAVALVASERWRAANGYV